MLKPDYKLLRFRAEVDWIELELSLARTTNFQALRNRFSFIKYVSAVDGSGNGSGAIFRLRLQAPKSWRDVERRLNAIESAFPFDRSPTIAGIEVSFDAYARGDHIDLLPYMAATFYRFSSRYASQNHRFSGKKGTTGLVEPIETVWQLTELLKAKRVLNIGNVDDLITQRIYVKSTDSGEDLPPHLHRARTEVTLKGNALPFRSVAAASDYEFANMSTWFTYRQFKPSIHPQVERLRSLRLRPGEQRRRQMPKAWGGGTRLNSSGTLADSHLNRLAKEALHRLSCRMRKS